ncbi:AraC family transcriptional regulator [Paenibacillus sp.]|uniref:AraC family transcriptional regulator n=1 Tax=Paenibacillus sp. TaxID=58172 RepID=UPI0028123ADB|nr:AraC family transcriptional regulator [Paenibacillus sp.]
MIHIPLYEDALTNRIFGKSQLPIFILEKQMTRNYPLHHHNFAELSLVLEGSGTEILNGKPHRFKRGTVSFLLPHHIHEIHIEDSPVHKINCMFDVQLLFSISDRELTKYLLKTGQGHPSLYELDEEQTVFMQQLFQSMRNEYENDRFGKDTLLHSMLLEALVYIVRTNHSTKQTSSPFPTSKKNIQDLIYYLHLNFREEITLTHLAEKFDWNPAYISRIFKQYAGRNFTDYLHTLRVERAASLLATTSMSIIDIAFEVGFDHSQTFSRVFKERKGVPPKLYRAAHKRSVKIGG